MENNQIIKNMKLVALEIKRELKRNQPSYSSVEVLVKSYSALLTQLANGYEKITTERDILELEEQEEGIAELAQQLKKKSIPHLLSCGYHRSVNRIVTSITELTETAKSLNHFLLRVAYPIFQKRVGVVGTDFATAQNQINKILSNSGEEVLEHQCLHSGKLIVYTRAALYETIQYSDSYRGKIMDTVYIDRNLSTKSINIANMYVRDGGEVRYFN